MGGLVVSHYSQIRQTKEDWGAGAIEWTDGDELITEILGKENPYHVSIVGGIDSGDNIQAREHTLDASSGAIEKHSLSSTSSYLPVGPDGVLE